MTDTAKTVTLTKVAGANLKTIDLGYWVKGEIARDPEVGEAFYVARSVRNGVEVPGVFLTSPVVDVVHLDPWQTLIVTVNSTWLMVDA